MNEELKQEMVKKAVDGKLPCSAARKIAEDLNIPYNEVGDAANDLGLRIKSCELGYF